jgi:hypothetical protein
MPHVNKSKGLKIKMKYVFIILYPNDLAFLSFSCEKCANKIPKLTLNKMPNENLFLKLFKLSSFSLVTEA